MHRMQGMYGYRLPGHFPAGWQGGYRQNPVCGCGVCEGLCPKQAIVSKEAKA